MTPRNVHKRTRDNIKILFDKFGHSDAFKSKDIEEIFNVKKSRASEIIFLLQNNNLIEESELNKYKFKK